MWPLRRFVDPDCYCEYGHICKKHRNKEEAASLVVKFALEWYDNPYPLQEAILRETVLQYKEILKGEAVE